MTLERSDSPVLLERYAYVHTSDWLEFLKSLVGLLHAVKDVSSCSGQWPLKRRTLIMLQHLSGLHQNQLDSGY
ncbi:hypothetical protein SLEP1_g58521 [Rubroshorea leprosula]|uniref:Uncharacterized protein n=1 Tax=Rubroshorea leprosula TaxID=152421 RepID=A0AAV5MSU3_9ROSI|nr:hypothetical protein SLEP1_g58521 [Rubroshorea leprosula]